MSTNAKIGQLKVKGKVYDLDVPKDLNENNPQAVGYVKGRTHWGTNTVVKSDWSVNSGSFVVLDNASENHKDPIFVRLFDKQGSKEYCFSLTKDTSRTFDVEPANYKQFKVSLSFSAPSGYGPEDEVSGTYSLTLEVEPGSLDVWPELVDRLFDVEVITEAERISPLFLPYTNLTQKDDGQIVISDDLNITDTLSVGYGTTATGEYSVAIGYSTQASGDYSHAVGHLTTATGTGSMAEGYLTSSSGYASHAEGHSTLATREEAHAEGWKTQAIHNKTHAEGRKTIASGHGAHAEGNMTVASGSFAHSEGEMTEASGSGAHAEGVVHILETRIGTVEDILADEQGTYLKINYSEADASYFEEGCIISIAPPDNGWDEGWPTDIDRYQYKIESPSKCPEDYNIAIDIEEPSEAYNLIYVNSGVYPCVCNQAIGSGSHAEGRGNRVYTVGSHAEGIYNSVSGYYISDDRRDVLNGGSHAEGVSNNVNAPMAHAEGQNNTTHGKISHIEGFNNRIGDGAYDNPDNQGHYSHVSGLNNVVTGNGSNVSGEGNTVSGPRSFVTGKTNVASNYLSFVAGEGNITSTSHQTIFGKYNKSSNAIFAIGNGQDNKSRSNAFVVYQDGETCGGTLSLTNISLDPNKLGTNDITNIVGLRDTFIKTNNNVELKGNTSITGDLSTTGNIVLGGVTLTPAKLQRLLDLIDTIAN